MANISFVTIAFLIATTTLAAPGKAFAYESGLVKTVRGQVHVERGAGRLEVKVGDPVLEKDRYIVSTDSSLGISMNDETLLSLGPGSKMVIDSYSYDPVTRQGNVGTSILRGTLRYVTGLIGRSNRDAVKVNTPTITIGIRGTEFIVEVPDAK